MALRKLCQLSLPPGRGRTGLALIAGLIGLVLTPGCIVEGRFYVQGTVRNADGEMIPGATASVRTCVPAYGPDKSQHDTTDANGLFNVTCWFGGMFVPVLPDSAVEFSAPGYLKKTVKLKSQRESVDFKRGTCARRPCYWLNVVLHKAQPLATTGPRS